MTAPELEAPYAGAQLVGPDDVLELSPDDVELLVLALDHEIEELELMLEDPAPDDPQLDELAGEYATIRDAITDLLRP